MSHAASASEVRPGDPPVIHHMDTATAYGAAKLGMWLFLATEILLFGGLFASFAIYRWMYLPQFHAASHHLNWMLGGTNTLVLLVSSYFAAMAVDAAKQGKNDVIVKLLTATVACGFIFLIIKYIEYSAKVGDGLFPLHFVSGGWGIEVNPAFNSALHHEEYAMFFGLYYCMTCLHALHVIAGMGLLTWVTLLAKKGRFSERYYTPVEVGALYWHLVDLIWIYLFPLLYLVG